MDNQQPGISVLAPADPNIGQPPSYLYGTQEMSSSIYHSTEFVTDFREEPAPTTSFYNISALFALYYAVIKGDELRLLSSAAV